MASGEVVTFSNGQALVSELLHRCQEREPALLVATDQILVNQRRDRGEVGGTHLLGSPKVEAGRKDREVPEQLTFVLRKQILAPRDRRPERLMAVRHVTLPARQERETALQPREKSVKGQHVDSGRRKLHGEREAVDTAADGVDGLPLHERRIDRTCTLHEQGDGVLGTKRLHGEPLLAADAQRFAAGDEEMHRGAGWQQHRDQ